MNGVLDHSKFAFSLSLHESRHTTIAAPLLCCKLVSLVVLTSLGIVHLISQVNFETVHEGFEVYDYFDLHTISQVETLLLRYWSLQLRLILQGKNLSSFLFRLEYLSLHHPKLRIFIAFWLLLRLLNSKVDEHED